MLKKESKKKFVNANYLFKTEILFANDDVLAEIGAWAKDTDTQVVYYTSSVLGNEKSVSFAFKSEEDLGMFTLRWHDVLEQIFLNSTWRAMHKVYEQIQARIMNGDSSLKTVSGPAFTAPTKKK